MTGELIEFSDVEVLVLASINADFATSFPGVPAVTRVPKERPKEFVRIMLTGGSEETLITENTSIILEAWAATEARAVKIINRARAVLKAQDGALFGVTVISTPANLPDPTTAQVRYTMLLGVRSYGTVSA